MVQGVGLANRLLIITGFYPLMVIFLPLALSWDLGN